MRILKKIFIIIVVLVVIFLAVAYIFGKSHCHIERTSVISQTPSVTFNFLNQIQNFNKFSPWYEIDPNAKYTFSGPSSGNGAKMDWSSEKRDVGQGSLMIVNSQPDSLIQLELNFMGSGGAFSTFHITPETIGSKVTWTFDVDNGGNPVGRFMSLFMDKMLGGVYEKGLSNLKTNLESMPQQEQ